MAACTVVFGTVVIAGAGTTPASAAGCAGAKQTAQAQGLGAAARALHCLINVERARHQLAPVRVSKQLGRAAARHSRTMIRTGEFSHQVTGEKSLATRVRSTGYLKGVRSWALGEAQAWAQGDDTNPQAVLADLLRSPPHRAILLDPGFRDVGLGLVLGVPASVAPGADGVTLTLDFGRSSRGS